MENDKLKRIIADVLSEVMSSRQAGNGHASAAVFRNNLNAACDDGEVPDLSAVDFSQILATPEPANGEAYLEIKRTSTARVGTWRAGPRYRTETYLRLRADHAKAMDAVFEDVPEELIDKLRLLKVTTRCASKNDYLTRPDLGRQFDEETSRLIKDKCIPEADVQLIVSDGLSSTAVSHNIADVFPAIVQGLELKRIKLGTPIFVKYGRVGCMDAITELVKSKVTVILLGERPGLATSESLSAYMTYGGFVGINEAARTVVSNIYKGGTNPVEAGAHIADLIERMLREKKSGIDLSR